MKAARPLSASSSIAIVFMAPPSPRASIASVTESRAWMTGVMWCGATPANGPSVNAPLTIRDVALSQTRLTGSFGLAPARAPMLARRGISKEIKWAVPAVRVPSAACVVLRPLAAASSTLIVMDVSPLRPPSMMDATEAGAGTRPPSVTRVAIPHQVRDVFVERAAMHCERDLGGAAVVNLDHRLVSIGGWVVRDASHVGGNAQGNYRRSVLVAVHVRINVGRISRAAASTSSA